MKNVDVHFKSFERHYCSFQLPHMTPYVRFCSCQLTAAALLQRKTENSPEFVEVHKVSDGVLVYGSVTHKCNDVSIPRSGPA